MDKIKAIELIKSTFESSYNEDKFKLFIKNIFKNIEEDGKTFSGQYIMKAYSENIKSYKRLFKYKLEEGRTEDNIDILAVKMSSIKSLETARTLQRNFIANYLKSKNKDAVIVAFYTDEDNGEEWRFSFVKRDLYLDNGKIKDDLTPAKRYSYLVGENETSHTAQQQLINLLEKEHHNPSIKEIESTFSIEKVTKEFFSKYKELFLNLVDNVEGIIEKDHIIKSNFTFNQVTSELFCKKLLGQIVFLYFLQKKGWLGVPRNKKWNEGNKKFLRSLFTCAELEEKNYFNDVLEPFFYGALATERDYDWYAPLDCKVPFLNGGLFEPINNYDWVQTDIIIPNELFSNKKGTGILDIFDTYNFTVKEDEPLEREVAVDPEMLGRVFEELLEIKDRKSKGAFYTPREIVHYMCQESLVNFLFNKLNDNIYSLDNSQFALGDNLLNQEIKIPKEDLRDFIKFGDVYQEITKNSEDTKTYKDRIPASIKLCAKDIDNALKNVKICDPAIGSGAFPVGIMHEVIKARRVLVEAGYLPEAQKRSTYRYKKEFIQNSLYGVDIEESAIEIAKLRLWLSLIVDEDDRDNIEPLPNLDYKLVQGDSLLYIERDLFNDGLLKDLERLKFSYFDENSKVKKKKLKKEMVDIISIVSKGMFDFKVYFSEVFDNNNGFDIILGNPPYVDSEEMVKNDKNYRDVLKGKYKTAKGNWDLFILFIELGLININNSHGVMYYIIPNKLISAKYAETSREFISSESNIIEILDFSSVNIFKSADVYPVVIGVTKKVEPNKNTNLLLMQSEELAKTKVIVSTDKLKYDLFWDKYFSSSNVVKILLKLQDLTKLNSHIQNISASATVSEAYEIKKYLISSSNDIKINSNYKFINTGTIDPFMSLWDKKKTQYIKDSYNMPLISREDIKKVNNTRLTQASSSKLIIAGMTKHFEVFYDIKGEYLAGKSTSIIIDDDLNKLKIICSIMNSQLMTFWLNNSFKSLKMSGGFLNINKNIISNIPIPSDIFSGLLATEIIKTYDKKDILNNLDHLNRIIYKAYNIKPEEIAIIEGREVKELIVITEKLLMDKSSELCKKNGFVDINTIAKDFNININESKDVKHGQIAFDTDRNVYTINVNNSKDNFTIAHEVCHIPYHNDDIIQYGAVGRKDDFSKHKSEEYKVNQLAEKILMPEDFVKEYLENTLYIDSIFITKSSDINKLAKKFKVSRDIAKFRLQNLGYRLSNNIM